MDIQTQAFQNLNNLQTLDLSGNQVLYLPALPLPKLLTLNLQASGLKGVNQAIVHTLPRLRDLLLEHNPIKCSDLLGIAEWASPCRINDRTELTATDILNNNNNNNNNSQSNVGQLSAVAATSPTIINIDLKSKYERLNSFFEKFHSICSRHALQMSLSVFVSQPLSQSETQPRTKQAACHQELHKKVEENSASSVLLAPQMSELLQNDDANVVVKMAPQQNQPDSKMELESAKAKNITAFNLVTTETFYEPINLTTTTTQATTMKSNFIPTLTTLITPVNYINATEPELTISSTVATPNMKTVAMSAATLTAKFQNNTKTKTPSPSSSSSSSTTSTTTVATNVVNETEKTKYLSKIIGEKKVVTLKLPKKNKGAKFDFSVMPNKKKQVANTTTVSELESELESESLSLIEKDILATQQTVDKLQTEHPHKHLPLHLELKDRHLIGTPLLTHKGENILVESDQLKNLPKTSTITTTTTTTTLAISQIENAKDTKWPRDITGLNEYDDKIAMAATQATLLAINNKNIKLEHDKDKKKATLKIQKFLTKHNKYDNAAKMLDTSDYDVNLLADTTMPTDADTETVTPLHKHSTVNMPIHYKQPHEMHTFHELQLQQLQLQDKHALAINKDTLSAHWLDARTPQSNGHPVFVILLSSLFFITLLFGLLHVYRCDMPWRRHLAPPRPHHQRHLSDDDQHSFLHFQHNNELTASYRKNYNSPLHHLTLKADTGSSNSSTGSGSSSSSPQSHVSSGGFAEEACYVEMTPVVSTHNNLLPMELLSISSKNCRLTEAESRGKQSGMLVDSALTTEQPGVSNASLVNNETNLLQQARCNNTHKTTITTKRTPTTRKFDLW